MCQRRLIEQIRRRLKMNPDHCSTLKTPETAKRTQMVQISHFEKSLSKSLEKGAKSIRGVGQEGGLGR